MKYKIIIRHFLFWSGLYLAWVLIFHQYSVPLSKNMTIEFCYLIFITLDYYLINNFIVPRFLQRKKYVQFIALTFVAIAISSVSRMLIAERMSVFFHQDTDRQTLFVNSVLNISLWVLLITCGKMVIDRMEAQKRFEALENEKIRSELEFLRLQINPHALFNSLNTIYGHIEKSNLVARSVLIQFSELLRYQLYDCVLEKVPLQKEMDYIRRYVEFQQLRKNENLIVDLNITITEGDRQIAPLLLIVPIENAFKFVGQPGKATKKIAISIFMSGSMLHGKIVNTVDPLHPSPPLVSGGIGLINLKRRLSLLYAQKHRLTTENTGECYEFNLAIDLA